MNATVPEVERRMTAADRPPGPLVSNSVRGRTGAALIGTGGALLAISPALPWVHVSFSGTSPSFSCSSSRVTQQDSVGRPWSPVRCWPSLALGVRHSRDWLRLMSFLLSQAVVALVAGPGTARLVDLVSHSDSFLGVGPGVIVVALSEIMLLAGAIGAVCGDGWLTGGRPPSQHQQRQ